MGNKTKNWKKTKGYLKQRLGKHEITTMDFIYNDRYSERDPEAVMSDFFRLWRYDDPEFKFLVRYFKFLELVYEHTKSLGYESKMEFKKEVLEFIRNNGITSINEFQLNPSLITLFKLQKKL